MDVGVVFPQSRLDGDPQSARKFAVGAEQLGFDHLLVYDHLLGHGHRGEDLGPYREPFVLLSYLASLTRHLELVPSVLVLPQRQTVLVAKQAGDLDAFAGGRLRLGIGVGWNELEYTALGMDARRRGDRIEEQVEVLRRLWSGDRVEFSGNWHHLENAALVPAPARTIPLWFGGYSDIALRRAASLGDGFIFTQVNDDLFTQVARLRRLVEERGRDPEAFGIQTMIPYDGGDRDEWERQLAACRRAGIDKVALDPIRAIDGELPDLDSYLSGIHAFAEVADLCEPTKE